MVYAVLVASRKLRHYFQSHKVTVVTSQPLKAVLHNPNATGSIAKWAAELAEIDIDFAPRPAIKSQVFSDFVAEWTPSSCPAGSPGGPAQLMPEKVEPVFTEPYWTLYFDGSSRKQGSGAGVLLVSP